MSIANMTIDMAKKTAQDWHKADIKAAVAKRGYTMRSLARAYQYNDIDTLTQALHRPYPKAERLIAKLIGVPPMNIWPSRYHADGAPKSGRGERGLGRHKRREPKQKCNALSAARNVKEGNEG